MIVMVWVRNRCDTAPLPIRHRDRIRRPLGADEGKPLLQIVKPGTVRRDCIQQISHGRVICAVTDENQMEQPCGIIDEIGNNSSPEVELSKVAIGHDEIRGALRVRPQSSVNMEHSGELFATGRSRDGVKCIRLNAVSLSSPGYLKQKINIGGDYSCCLSA